MIPGVFTVCRHDPSGIIRFVERTQASVVKAFSHVTSGPWWADVAKAAPSTMRIVVPAWVTDNASLANPEADADSVAAYMDTNPGVPRCAITKNEVRYCSDSRDLWNIWVDYLCRYLRRAHQRGIDSVVGEINSGHPYVSLIDDVDQWQCLAPVEAEMQIGDAWGLHEYWNEAGPDAWWPWTAGRHTRCPTAHRIVIDECGMDYSVGRPAGAYDPRGWNGRLGADAYVGQLVRYHQMLTDPRVVGTAVFLFDYEDRQWFSFDCMPLQERILARLGEFGMTDSAMRMPARLEHPIPGATITAPFGERNQYTQFHLGLDFSAVQGTPVRAAAAGTVDRVIDLGSASYGRYVRLKHGWGFTLYAHLSEFRCAKGDTVHAGQVIGLSGNTGYSFGGHLHYEVQPLDCHTNSGRVDPYPLLFGGADTETGGTDVTEAQRARARRELDKVAFMDKVAMAQGLTWKGFEYAEDGETVTIAQKPGTMEFYRVAVPTGQWDPAKAKVERVA
jgi:hypothetical protein